MGRYAAQFSQTGHDSVCSCGRHRGHGLHSVEKRAAIAGRMRDRLPNHMSKEMREFLSDWEAFHGPVKWDFGPMIEVEKLDGKGTTMIPDTLLISEA